MIKFIIVFIALLFTALFVNIKLTTIARAIAFHEYEKLNESKTCLACMFIAIICWSLFITFF